MAYRFIWGVNKRILLESKGDFELVLIGASEVYSDSCDRNWALWLRKTEFYHESMLLKEYLTSLGFVYIREMWYWYFLVQVSTMP